MVGLRRLIGVFPGSVRFFKNLVQNWTGNGFGLWGCVGQGGHPSSRLSGFVETDLIFDWG